MGFTTLFHVRQTLGDARNASKDSIRLLLSTSKYLDHALRLLNDLRRDLAGNEVELGLPVK